MKKIHVHDADILRDPLPGTELFDLSVFLQAYYFCPAEVWLLAWADIVSRTKIGGYILTDINFRPQYLEEMGLERVHEVLDNRYHGGQSSILYRRVRDAKAIRQLASLRK